MPHSGVEVLKFKSKSKKPPVAFFIRLIKGVTGFFGVFIIFPVLIALDCFQDNEWVWNKIETEK